jgi:phosphoglycerate dehydrogenase-like enzyme
MPDWAVDAIRQALPEDWEMHVVETPADGSGDGATAVSRETLEAVSDATVYLGFGVPEDILRAGPRLRWVHSGAAGVSGSLTPEMRERDVIFTNSAGVHGAPVAETVLAMILYFARGLDFAVGMKARGRWCQKPFLEEDTPVAELAGRTVGIMGYGGIGTEVARRAAPLGARLLALKRRPVATPDEVVELLYGSDGLGRLLAESDYLVVAAPHTFDTENLLDQSAFAAMKRGAVLINVSRGSLVEEEALLQALRGGRLRGVALDVFRQEPLPEGHPFWSMPNVLILPHVSGVSRSFWRRETELIRENIRRFLAGQRLRNTVDKNLGY